MMVIVFLFIDVITCYKMEKISVLIPAYNVEKYVEDAIRSIMNQTYTNLEIIIVDDCSDDNTYNILLRLKLEDCRIKLYRNNVNSKIVNTLNFALSKASGEFIARMDADDLAHPLKLEKQIEFLKNNSSISLVGCNYNVIDENSLQYNKSNLLLSPLFIRLGLPYISPVVHIWMTRKTIYDAVGFYRIPGVEDYDFLLRLHKLGFKCANLGEYLYSVRVRKGNTLSSIGLIQLLSKRYVYKLFREKSDLDSFTELLYNQSIKCTDSEKKRYQTLFAKYTHLRQQSFLSFALGVFILFFRYPKWMSEYFYNKTMVFVIVKIEKCIKKPN